MDRDLGRSINLRLEAARAAYATGDWQAAIQRYDAILADQPDEPRALCLRGLIRRDRGDILGAETDFRRAIKVAPDMPLTYQLLGDLLHNAKHLVMAADVYERGLAVDPVNLPILANLAHTRLGLGHFEACLDLSRQVVAQDIAQQESWFRIGAALCQLQRFDDAIAPLQTAIAQKHDCLRSRAALCVALDRTGRSAEAAIEVAAAKPWIERDFDHLTQFNEVLAWLNSIETAFRVLEEFLARHPDHAQTWMLLAKLNIVSGREREGNELLAKAAGLAPDDADIHLTWGLQRFKFGDYRAGLELYRQRWQKPQVDPREGWWHVPAPAWAGEVLHEGALQVWTEQGIGDLAMFAGAFMPLADKAPRVMIETIGRFRGLMQRSFPWAEVYERDWLKDDFVTARDVRAHAPVGDLPLLLGLDLENMPTREGYLIPDAAITWQLRDRYRARFPGKVIVGISWRSGNKTSATTRSAELDHWRDILTATGYGFVSLQYGAVAPEVADANQRLGTDIYCDPQVDPLTDLDLFAAQVAAVDLVISVDNSTVHFAGALGKQVWVLLPFIADWRWLNDRDDTLWYANARLFRQDRPARWSDVMAHVATALPAYDIKAARADFLGFMRRCTRQLAPVVQSPDAEVFLRQVLQQEPNDAEALNALGQIGLVAGHTSAVMPLLARAVQLAPDRVGYRHDLARATPSATDRTAGLGLWSGQPNAADRLYLWSDGNLATDIAACAALRSLRDQVGHLVVACHRSLMPLLARQDRRISVFAVDDISAAELAGLDITAQAPLSILIDPQKISAGPWLQADLARVDEQKRHQRDMFGDRPVIGLIRRQEDIWAGVATRDWLELPENLLPEVMRSLNVGLVAFDDPGDIWPVGAIWYDPRLDLRLRADGFAAALAAVDLVIAVEGAAAWLATALGKPLLVCEAEMTGIPAVAHFQRSPNGSWGRATAQLRDALSAFMRPK